MVTVRLPSHANPGPEILRLVAVDGELVEEISGTLVGGARGRSASRQLRFRFDGREIATAIGEPGAHELSFSTEAIGGLGGVLYEGTAELFLSLAGTHSLVVVEHDMAFIETIARKVTVLHEGSVLAEGPMEQVKNDPRVFMLDLQYHDIRMNRGLYYLLERSEQVERVLEDEEVIKAKTEPPPDTRARMRGEFIKLARQNSIQYDLDWSNIRLGNLLNVRVICNNPFETDIEKVAELVRTIQKTNLRKTSLSKLVIQS